MGGLLYHKHCQHKLSFGLHKQAALIEGSRKIRYHEGAEGRLKMASGAFSVFLSSITGGQP
jgi:hypothetical protein